MSEPCGVPHLNKSEVALFGTDVGTDIVNGYNLIEEGHTIWGTIMCVLPLAPVGIIGPLFIFDDVDNKICAILVILLLYVPALPIGTVGYIMFVLVVGLIRIWNPNLSDRDDTIIFGMDGEDIVDAAVGLRIAEIVTESCPQSMLGNL